MNEEYKNLESAGENCEKIRRDIVEQENNKEEYIRLL